MSNEQSELRFDGRVAIVTGAGRGIGREHALLLAHRGASVVVNDRGGGVRLDTAGSQEPANLVTEEIRSFGGRAMANFADVSVEQDVNDMVNGALKEFGRVDIVIANAGTSQHNPIDTLTLREVERLWRIHIGGSFLVTKAVWPHMMARRYGRIVMTGSSAGLFGTQRNCHYSAAKGGVVALTKSLALDAPSYIHINCVGPRASTRLGDNIEDPELRRQFHESLPTDQITPLVAWLSHEECSVTGKIFDAGGGTARKVFFGLTRGYSSPDLTPELIRDNLEAVLDPAGFIVPSNTYDVGLDT